MTDLRGAVEAAEMLLDRRANDGLIVALADWTEETRVGLFRHQRQFLESTKSEAWVFGANRSGKSEGLAYGIASFARFGVFNPRLAYAPGFVPQGPKRVWVVSLTFDMSRNIMQPKLFNNGARIASGPPLIPDSEIASWNITNQTLILKNGSIIIFKSCDAGRDAFMGADVDLYAPDEVPDEDIYKESVIRIGAERRLLIRGAATILPPVGVPGGVSWMFNAKAKPWLDLGATVEARNAKSPDLDIFTAGIRDNKAILTEEISRLASVFSPGSPEWLIRVEGMLLPSIGGALVYPKASRGYHVVEALAPLGEDGSRHAQVIPYLPLCLCVDFNPENGIWTIGQRVGKVFRVLDEITLERSDIASMVYAFRAKYPAHQAELWLYGDATGIRLEAQTGMSSFHMVSNYLAGYPVPITFKVPACNPSEKARTEAVNQMLAPPTGERLIEFSPLCVETFKDAEGTKWNARGKIDKIRGRRSDGMDTVGYWVSYEAPVAAAFAPASTLKSIKTPAYHSGAGSPFPIPRAVRIGNRWYGRRVNA